MPLTIGSKLPDDLILNNVKNYPTKTIRLADLKGKMILLDFWATWCSSCVEGFPKMDELQNEFKNDLQVILVNAEQTGDDEEKTKLLFEKRKKYANYDVTLPYLVGDTNLQKLFPHKYVPNYVWINKEGVVTAITYPQEVVKKNIQSVLRTGNVKVHIKKDILEFHSDRPLFNDALEEVNASLKYRSQILNYVEGLRIMTGTNTNQNKEITRYFINNYSLSYLYRDAFRKELSQIPNNRLLFNLSNKDQFKKAYLEGEKYENRFCYEIITPGTTSEKIYEYMRSDLGRSFSVIVKRQKVKAKSLILKISNRLKKSYSKGGYPEIQISDDAVHKFVRNIPVATFIDMLNEFIPLPIIDESFSTSNIDIELPENFKTCTIEQIKELLTKIGFTIKEEARLLDFAVFKDVQ